MKIKNIKENEIEDENEYNHFMKIIKEGIDKVNRYELEVKNLRKELKEKDNKIHQIIKDYDLIQSFKKGTNDEERIRLKKLFNVKQVASGVYSEGFFDGLKLAEKSNLGSQSKQKDVLKILYEELKKHEHCKDTCESQEYDAILNIIKRLEQKWQSKN